MDLFTYLMAKNGNNSSVHGDLFSYLLGKGQSQTQTISGVTIYIPDAKKLVSFMMTKESTQDNIAYVDVGEWEQGTINSNGVNQESSNVVRTKDYIKVHPNVLYNISRSIYNSYMGFRFYDINKNYLGNHGTTGMVSTNQAENRMVASVSSMTMIILNNNVAYMRMFDNSNNLNTIYTISTEDTPSPDYPQEVKGVEGSVNVYVSDGETTNTYTINLGNNELVGIGDYKDELKVDKSGHVFINKKTGKVVLNGNETIRKTGTTLNNIFQYLGLNTTILTPPNNNSKIGMLSNCFIENDVNSFYNSDLINIGVTRSGAINIGMGLQGGIDTVEKFTNFLEQRYTQNNPVYIVYPLATPELIDLQTTVDLKLFKGANTITNSEDGYMTIQYH